MSDDPETLAAAAVEKLAKCGSRAATLLSVDEIMALGVMCCLLADKIVELDPGATKRPEDATPAP